MKVTNKGIERRNLILAIISAFLITFAIFVIGGFEASDMLLGLIFVVTLIAFCKDSDGRAFPDRGKTLIGLVSAIWTGSYLIYAGDRLGAGMENRLFVLVFEVLATVGIFIGINTGLKIFVARLLVRRADYVEESQAVSFSMKKMLLYSGIILLAMLPLFLMNYPATMTVDSFDQFAQVRNLAVYSDHHPWVHTMLIKLFYELGFAASADTLVGIAVYVIFQMLVTALSVGYAASTMEALKKNRIWALLIVLGYVLYPYHLAYSITIWKDILFSDMVLVLTVTMYKIILSVKRSDACIKAGDCILLAVSGTAMCLLRHNGLYAYIITAVVVLITAVVDVKKNKENAKKRLMSLCLVAVITLCVACVIKGPVQSAFGVAKGDYGHNLAIPLQQIGRTVSQGGEISDADVSELEKINSLIYIQNNYEPGGADNMIQWLVAGDSKYFEGHKLNYLGVWLRIGIKNPMSYLKAYADQTKGYYTTMMPEQIAYYGILPNEDELCNEPVLGAGVRIKINELCSKIQNMVPVYGIFYSMGACLLLLILWLAVAVLKGEKYKLSVAVPVLALTLTILIATPLVADLRYAYPLMLAFPTLTGIFIGTER